MDTIETIKQYAMENGVPVLLDESFEFIKEQIEKYNCQSILEIGTAIGQTSIRLAQWNDNLRIVTIERDSEMIKQAKRNIIETGLDKRIFLIEQDARDVKLDQSFDCIFIDAAKSQYTRFFKQFSPLCSEHGIIISDNMNFHGLVEHPERTHNRHTKQLVRKLKEYHQFLEGLNDFIVEFYEIGDGIAVARRK